MDAIRMESHVLDESESFFCLDCKQWSNHVVVRYQTAEPTKEIVFQCNVTFHCPECDSENNIMSDAKNDKKESES